MVQEKEYASRSFNNPFSLKINQATVLVNDLDKKPAALTIKLEGTGFKSDLLHNAEGVGEWTMRYVSPTEVIFRVTDPKDFFVLSLSDAINKKPVGASIARPAPPEKAPEPEAEAEPTPPKKGKQQQ